MREWGESSGVEPLSRDTPMRGWGVVSIQDNLGYFSKTLSRKYPTGCPVSHWIWLMEGLQIRESRISGTAPVKVTGQILMCVCLLCLHPVFLGLGSLPKAYNSVSKGVDHNLNRAQYSRGQTR